MTEKSRHEQSEKGLSAGVLALVFLVWVGVCAVFFSLGFLVGYNEKSSKAPVTERVTTPSAIPPTVNPPLQASQPTNQPSTSPPAETVPAGESPPVASQLPPGSNPASTAATSGGAPPTASDLSPQRGNKGESAPQESPETEGAEVGMGYTVQVAASRVKKDAEALANILKTRGYPVLLLAPGHPNTQDNIFRVQVGPFTSRADAEKVRARLVQEGFKPFIRH